MFWRMIGLGRVRERYLNCSAITRRRTPVRILPETLECRTLLATYVVDNRFDVSDGDFGPGQLSLREAVEQANANAGQDTIQFAPGVGGAGFNPSLSLGSSLEVTDDVLIQGPGADKLRLSTNNGPLFVVSSGVTLEISDLDAGGSGGTLFSGVGGTFSNSGILIIRGMRVTGNAEVGAGVYSTGDLIVVDSTISGAGLNGGGIYVESGTALVSNSTISGAGANHAGGGIYVNSGIVSVSNSTLVKNHASSGTAGGGGLFVNDGSDVTLTNTIVMGNTGSSGDSDIIGTINPTSSFNIIGDADTSGGLMDGVNNNIVGNMGVGTLDINTVLNPELTDNGGPTRTHAVMTGSVAIDSGNNALTSGPDGPLTSDQRGFGRYVNGTVDRGAYEFAPLEDVVSFNSNTGIWYVGISDSTEFSNTKGPRWSLDFTWDIVSGDFTGDGLTDVAGRMQENGQWYVAAANGTTLVSQAFGKWASNSDRGWQYTLAGDFDGDGTDDVMAQDSAGRWWAGISNGTAFEQQVFGRWNTQGWEFIRPADLNGDGKTDLLGRHAASGAWWGAVSDGVHFTTMPLGRWAPSAGWQNFRIADFTGDGADDVLAQSAEGYWQFAALNSGSDRFDTFFAGRTSTDISLGLPQVGDFDGDGKADLVTFSSRFNGQAWVKLSTGTGMETAEMWSQIGILSRRPIGAADVNGDGRDDVVFTAVTSDRVFSTLLSTGSRFNPAGFGGFFGARSSLGFQLFYLDEFGG